MPVTRILHRAGNFRDSLGFVDHPAVDAIEADIWVWNGHLVAHHDRPLGPLPFTFGRSGLRRRPREIHLDELLSTVEDSAGLYIDLRSLWGDPSPELVRELARIEDRSHLKVTCESWKIADRLRVWMPSLRVAYSVRSEKQMASYVRERREGMRPETPIVARHTLVESAAHVAELRELAGEVGVWTIDDVDRAIELATWGVDELTSNSITVLNAI